MDICEVRPDLNECQPPPPPTTPPPGDDDPTTPPDDGDDCLLPLGLLCPPDDGDDDDDDDDDNTSPNPVMGDVDCKVVSPTELRLSWPAAKDDKDEIQYYTIDGRPGIDRQETATRGGTFTGLEPGTDYEFEVMATDADGNNSEWSVEQCSTKADTENPTVPAPLKVDHITSTTADLAWKPSKDDSGVDHYEVTWEPVDGGFGGSGETDGTDFYVTGLAPETTYTFSVVAVDIVGKSSAAASIEDTTLVEDTEAPGVPANVKVERVDDNTVRVSWGASSDNQSRASDIRYDVTVFGPLVPARGSVTGETSITVDYFGLLSGDITASVTATDEADNRSEAGAGEEAAAERQTPEVRSSTPGKAKSDAPVDKPGLPKAPVEVPTDEPTEEKSPPLLPPLGDVLDGDKADEAPAEEPEAEPSESESPAERPITEEP
ncbi:MAG: fibronectin type III domain-containing protein, partial [Pseudonocardiaceae bacterium]